MTPIQQLLPAHSVCLQADVASKKKALEQVAALLASDRVASNDVTSNNESLDQDEILVALIAREKLGTTGLGDGVAIPHCRVSNCTAPRSALLTLRSPIDFEAIDQRDVDVVWALIVPEQAEQQHLDMLALMAARLNNPDLLALLRDSNDGEHVHRAICNA